MPDKPGGEQRPYVMVEGRADELVSETWCAVAARDLLWSFSPEARDHFSSSQEQLEHFVDVLVRAHALAYEGSEMSCPACQGLRMGLDGLRVVWETIDLEATNDEGEEALQGVVTVAIGLLAMADKYHVVAEQLGEVAKAAAAGKTIHVATRGNDNGELPS